MLQLRPADSYIITGTVFLNLIYYELFPHSIYIYIYNTTQYPSTNVPFVPLSAELGRGLYSLISSLEVTGWPDVGFIRSISPAHTEIHTNCLCRSLLYWIPTWPQCQTHSTPVSGHIYPQEYIFMISDVILRSDLVYWVTFPPQNTVKWLQAHTYLSICNVEASGNTKLELSWMLDQCFQILWNISSPNQMFSRNIGTEQLFVIYHSNHSQYILMFLHLNCGILVAFCVLNHMLNIFSITLIVLNPINLFFQFTLTCDNEFECTWKGHWWIVTKSMLIKRQTTAIVSYGGIHSSE